MADKDEKPIWKRDGFQDDGTLSCLGLGTDRESKVFSCPVKTQSELVGQSFYIIDAFDDLKIKDAQKSLYKAKFNLSDGEDATFKVWTGSAECMRILKVLIDNNLFPRKVTLLSGKRGSFRFK